MNLQVQALRDELKTLRCLNKGMTTPQSPSYLHSSNSCAKNLFACLVAVLPLLGLMALLTATSPEDNREDTILIACSYGDIQEVKTLLPNVLNTTLFPADGNCLDTIENVCFARAAMDGRLEFAKWLYPKTSLGARACVGTSLKHIVLEAWEGGKHKTALWLTQRPEADPWVRALGQQIQKKSRREIL